MDTFSSVSGRRRLAPTFSDVSEPLMLSCYTCAANRLQDTSPMSGLMCSDVSAPLMLSCDACAAKRFRDVICRPLSEIGGIKNAKVL